MRGRVLFPETGFTKADAVAYYRRIAKYLLPHIRRRPMSFKRYPDTINAESFWEKDAPSFTPEWIERARVARRSGESEIAYIVVNNVRALTWVAEVGGVELHPFLHRLPRLDRPTDVVFDLDPGPGAALEDCCRVAQILRTALHAARLESFVKVSGSKGLQVYAPLNTKVTHDSTLTFAQLVAEEIARAHPELATAKMTKSLRTKRVFIDWSQNDDYKTTVAVYSLRAKRDTPFVSMPVRWEELRRPDRLEFDPDRALARVSKIGDVWGEMLRVKQSLTANRQPARGERRAAKGNDDVVVNGVRLPKPKSQSGRRLFILPKTDIGNELWLDMHGKFKRWILRPDREGESRLIAMPAGDFKIDPEYYRGEVPARWRRRVKIEDAGAYEVVEGSYRQRRFDLFFTGRVMRGRWVLEKVTDDDTHRSWTLEPVA